MFYFSLSERKIYKEILLENDQKIPQWGLISRKDQHDLVFRKDQYRDYMKFWWFQKYE
jgi:hypothetical protein